MLNLSEIKIGQKAEISDFCDQDLECHCTRFGIEKGQVVTCIARPGPIVIERNRQQIAIGKNLSEQIYVEVV